jgi:hypothetical protein
MYGYWALLPSLGFLRRFGFLITILQTSQMVIGLSTILYVIFACPLSWEKNMEGDIFALMMYAVYFYLFYTLTMAKLAEMKMKKNSASKKSTARSKKDN